MAERIAESAMSRVRIVADETRCAQYVEEAAITEVKPVRGKWKVGWLSQRNVRMPAPDRQTVSVLSKRVDQVATQSDAQLL